MFGKVVAWVCRKIELKEKEKKSTTTAETYLFYTS